MRWWFMKLPPPSSTCPIVPPVSWLLLCLVSVSSLLSYQYTQQNTPDVQIHFAFLSLSIVLQLFCSSPKAALRYAAVRTLNKVGLNRIEFVISCSISSYHMETAKNTFLGLKSCFYQIVQKLHSKRGKT